MKSWVDVRLYGVNCFVLESGEDVPTCIPGANDESGGRDWDTIDADGSGVGGDVGGGDPRGGV